MARKRPFPIRAGYPEASWFVFRKADLDVVRVGGIRITYPIRLIVVRVSMQRKNLIFAVAPARAGTDI